MSVTEIRYGKVNHDRVRAAMRKVGDQLEAERRQRVAIGQAEIVARGGHICEGVDHRTGWPCEWGAALLTASGWRCVHHAGDVPPLPQSSRHAYGPHRPEDAPGFVEVLPRGKWPKPVKAAIHPAVLRQRQQINDLAHRNTQPTPGGTP